MCDVFRDGDFYENSIESIAMPRGCRSRPCQIIPCCGKESNNENTGRRGVV